MRKWIFLLVLLSTVAMAWVMFGCSGTNQPVESDVVNTTYYNSLKEGNFVNLPAAQPQLPDSGELFSENRNVFRLEPANATTLQKKMSKSISSDFALYSPSPSGGKKVASAISEQITSTAASSTTAIPSLKRADIIPNSCTGLSGASFRECLDNINSTAAPTDQDHISTHTPQSLNIEIGSTITDSIALKTVQTFTKHISNADRESILSKLTDFTNNFKSHANIDLNALDPFNPNGYALKSVVISDGSFSDANNDSILEQHSTMITEIAKPIDYHRSNFPELDSCMQKYATTIEDHYVLKITTYLHLDHLKNQREALPVLNAANTNPETSDAIYESFHNAKMINHALDSNIIKYIYGSNNILPSYSTEYTFMFQIDQNQINNQYMNLLDKISDSGDSVCQEIVEQHINPRTAIINGTSSNSPNKSIQKSGSELTVFYQVPTYFTPQFSAKITEAITGQNIIATDSETIQDYCMMDANGQKVAIIDPLSNDIIPACEKFNQKVMAKTVMMTKSGACKGDKNNWAYYPSRLQTSRFGRGIQWIFTEWLLHNQVGDYKNIHWHQSVWKSGVQVAVKGGKIALATYLKIQIGAIKVKNDDGTDKKKSLIYAKKLLPLLADIVMKMNGVHIAGHKLKIPYSIGNFLSSTTNYFPQTDTGSGNIFGNPTIDNNLITEMSDGVKPFLIDRITDAAAQMLDVTIVGWEDISDRSHYGCFEFSY